MVFNPKIEVDLVQVLTVSLEHESKLVTEVDIAHAIVPSFSAIDCLFQMRITTAVYIS